MSFSYSLIDSGNFQKLEQVGPYRIVRPSPQAVWSPSRPESDWNAVDAKFNRFSGGDGKWTVLNRSMEKSWAINYGGLNFQLELTDFGHLGLFPEQILNWQRIRNLCFDMHNTGKEPLVLNLFAYTGGSSLAAAQGGARVFHVDASKTSVAWARANAERNQLENSQIHWMIDDAQKFVQREIKRSRRYHGIILDPPSFGRGAKSEVWKIEEHLIDLLNNLKSILADDFKFFLLSSHSHGYTPLAMKNLILDLGENIQGRFLCEEMTVAEQLSGRVLPSGASCFFVRDS